MYQFSAPVARGKLSTLVTTPSNRVALSEQDHNTLLFYSKEYGCAKNVTDPAFLLERGKEVAQLLSHELANALALLRLSHGPSFLVLTNLPQDPNLPAPPQDGKRPAQKRTWISELNLVAMAYLGGLLPYSYREEKGGDLIHEIAPIPNQEDSLSNAGRIPLGFHTDHSILHSSYRPEFLMLHGLVNTQQVPTYIAEIDKALEALSPQHKDLLRQPRYRVESAESMRLFGGKRIVSEERPLVGDAPEGVPQVAGNLYAVRASDAEAQAAVNALAVILPEIAHEVVVKPGEILLFDNQRCLHSRAAVEGERWLQRVFCRKSLAELRLATGTKDPCHVFDIEVLTLQ